MNWSLHKKTDLICLVITAVTLIVTVVFMNSEKLGLTKLTSDASADYYGVFSDRDYRDSWSEALAVRIDLSDLDHLGSNGGAYVLDGDLNIVTAGTYVLSGSLQNHQVIVNAGDEKVQLVFDGVDINHDTLSPVLVSSADKVFVTLVAASDNVITAGNLASPEASSAGSDAAIYARSDLAFNGSGSLQVTASGGHGIKSTDDLIITNGNYTVQADNTALLGKDSVRIADGNFTLFGSDGIKANNITKATKGYVSIFGGQFVLDVTGDGIQAETNIYISGGSIQITAGDDGIHAEQDVNIDDGVLTVSRSNEGIEGYNIYVNGGEIDVTSSDDGFNAGSGLSVGPGWQQTSVQIDPSDLPRLEINGGLIRVYADGDGLDSNGHVIINGGEVFVDGPTNAGNGALDSGSESGGELLVHGGTVLALGAAGMDESFAATSSQNSFRVTFSERFAAGDELVITGDDGEELMRYQISKSGNSVVFSSPLLQQGQTYNVQVGSQTQSVTQDSVSVGADTGMRGPGGGMRPGEMNGDMQSPEGMMSPEGMEGMAPPDGMMMPPEMMGERPEMMDGSRSGRMRRGMMDMPAENQTGNL